MSRSVKILALALGLSLIVNLFVAGYWLGGWPGRNHHRHHAGAMTMDQPSFATLRLMAAHLTPEQQDALRAKLRAIKQTKKQQISTMRTLMQDIDQQLRATEIDRAQLLASYEALRQAGDATRQPFVALVTDTLMAMNADQRRAFLDDVTAQRRDHWRRHRPDSPSDQPPR